MTEAGSISDDAGQPPLPSPSPKTLSGSRVGNYSLINYLSQALGLITGPLTVRALHAPGRGTIAEVAVFATLLSLVFTAGVEAAIVHDAARHPERRPQLLGAALRLTLFVAPAIFVVAAAILLGPLASLPRLQFIAAAVALGTCPLGVLAYLLQGLLVAEGNLSKLAWTRTLPIWLTGMFVIVLFAVGGLSVTTYLFGTAVAMLAQVLLSLRFVALRPRRGAALAPLLSFGLRGAIGTVLALVNISLDQAIIGPFLGRAQLGYYAVAVSLAGLPSTVAFALAFRSFGDVAGGGERTGSDAPNAATAGPAARSAAWIRISFVIVTVLVAGLLLVAPVAAPILYGQAFAHHVIGPLLLLGPGMVALGVSSTAIYSLTALGRPGLGTIAQLAGLVLTGIGLPVALPTWGIDGAAVVSSVAYIGVLASSLLLIRRCGGSPLLPRPSDLNQIREWIAPSRLPFVGRAVGHGRGPGR